VIDRIDHIGIAVSNLDEAIKLYTQALGLEVSRVETIVEQNAKTAIIPVGESKIELLESTSSEGVIARFIEKRGEGIHHVALAVNNIQEAIELLREKGIPMIDEKARKGVENTCIAFLHPKGIKILLELVES